MVLPLPDSPTSPSDSPTPMWRDTSFTAAPNPPALAAPRSMLLLRATSSYLHNSCICWEEANKKVNRCCTVIKMRKVFCPRCNAETVHAGGYPFCSICGWNRGRVEEKIRAGFPFSLTEILWPILFLLLVRFLSKSWGEVFFFGLFIFAGLVYLYVRAKQHLELVESAKPISPGSQTGPSVPADLSFDSLRLSDPLVKQLAALPKPRVVRFTPFGRTRWLAFAVGWIVLTPIMLWIGRQDLQRGHSNLSDLMWTLFFPLFTGLILSLALISEQRNRKLLKDGELTAGRVISQRRTGGRHPRSLIVYSFTDRSGIGRQRESTDHSRSYFEEMIVPVFYDAQDPRRSLALCGTYLKIVTPEGQLLPEEQT